MAVTSAEAGRLTAELTQRLVDQAAADGGWPYYAREASRIEPTAWAILALDTVGASETGPRDRAQRFLRSLQRPDGWLLERAVPDVNFGWNGLALLALGASGVPDDADARLGRALLSARGVQLQPDLPSTIRQDNSLQAWSWVPDTFSWIEPTAWCLLAIKRRLGREPGAADRVRGAEAVLRDRVCHPGGWNYGNSNVFEKDLHPYVPTTALGLLAMQDRSGEDEVAKSLAWLEAHSTSERSAMALSLAATALHLYGRPARPVLDALAAQYARTAFLDNTLFVAMALFALTLEAHGGRTFRLEKRA